MIGGVVSTGNTAYPSSVSHLNCSLRIASLYPLELVKTRMQVMGGQNPEYSSFSRSVATVFRQEGFRGFFQGLSPAVFAASGSWGGYLYFYEASKARKLKKYQEKYGSLAVLSSTDYLLAGYEAGALLVVIFNPFWVVKTRLALQGAETSKLQKYTGMAGNDRVVDVFSCWFMFMVLFVQMRSKPSFNKREFVVCIKD